MKMTIGKKLFAGFFAVLFLLGITVGVSYYQINAVDKNYTDLINDKANKLIMIKSLDVQIKKEQASLRGYLLLGDQTALNNFNKAHETYLKTSKSLSDAITHKKAQKFLSELNQIEDEYNQFSKKVFQLKEQNKTDEYTTLVATEGRKIMESFDKKIEEFTDYQQSLLDKGNHDATEEVKFIIKFMLILGFIAILFSIFIAIYMTHIISNPVKTVAQSARKIASGDLTVEDIKVKNRDEIGDLANSFNQMAESLREMIQKVGKNAEQVAASAEELTASAEQTSKAVEHVAESTQEVAAGMDEQVQSIEETSQTINEMSIGIQQIANNAQIVSSSAMDASEKASEGNRLLKTAVKQMHTINETVDGLSTVVGELGERSKEINQIIAVITDIASQTNLLALNAAIEAARAGEHGRGFAVVAEEVRKLAEQSAQSAQQIYQLISTIQEETNLTVQSMDAAKGEVLSGIEVVNTAGNSFEQIERSINNVTVQIQEVSSAVQQMAASSEQIVQSMKMISQISESSSGQTMAVSSATEEQLAAMEEISSAANTLTKMAEALQSLIEKFKI
jgi:methyl-accepting chemotaxis protein